MTDYRRAMWACLCLLPLLIACALWVPRTSPVGPELVRNPGFSPRFSPQSAGEVAAKGGIAGWVANGSGRHRVDGDTLVLRNDDPAGRVALSQRHTVPPESRRIEFTAEVATRDVVEGPDRWHTGRGVLISIVDGSPDYRIVHEAFGLLGDNGWSTQRYVFTIPPRVEELVLQFQLARATGELRVRSPSLVPVVYTAPWRVAGIAALVLGLLAAAWMFLPYLRAPGPWPLAGVATVSFILIACLVPHGPKMFLYDTAMSLLRWAPEAAAANGQAGAWGIFGGEHTDAFRIGHFLAFAAASFSLALCKAPVPRWVRLAQLVLLGALTEALQAYVPHRSGSPVDWGVDCLGIALGALLAAAALRLSSARGSGAAG